MTQRWIKRLVVGISGASGIIYGIRLLDQLRELGIESHLVVTKAAGYTRAYESSLTAAQLKAKADYVYASADLSACLSSGSYRMDGMVVAPCSMRSLAEIAMGNTTGLLTRSADVMLKERKPLILLARETPLTSIHLGNMLAVTQAGGIVMPPVPAFYARPRHLEEMVDYTLLRVLDLLGIELPTGRRWGSYDT